MSQYEIITKLTDLKVNLQHRLGKKIHQMLKNNARSEKMTFEEKGTDNYLDDLPLTINRDPSPRVKFYTTENSELSRGSERELPKGIDSFGEKDTFEIDEAVDFQTNRDRKQNSDLSKRFYTSGMELDDLNKN